MKMQWMFVVDREQVSIGLDFGNLRVPIIFDLMNEDCRQEPTANWNFSPTGLTRSVTRQYEPKCVGTISKSAFFGWLGMRQHAMCNNRRRWKQVHRTGFCHPGRQRSVGSDTVQLSALRDSTRASAVLEHCRCEGNVSVRRQAIG